MADRIPSTRDRYVELCLEEERASTPHQPQIRQPQPPRVCQPQPWPRRTQATEDWRELTEIATALGEEPTQWIERIRSETIPEQRHIAMWVLCQAGLSMRAVGRLLQYDSKTVSYAVGRIEQKRLADGAFAARVDSLVPQR